MKQKTEILFLISILFFAAIFRLTNLNWDQGFHLHPDERAIILSVVHLHFSQTIAQLLSPNSSWNPHFFAYGSFPFYLLRIVGNIAGLFNPLFAQYDLINLIGRAISALADMASIVVLYFLGKKISSGVIGLLAAALYAISVLPIQLSHFYAVDTLLTLFILVTLYLLILFYEKPTGKKAILIGITLGLSLATKVSAIVLTVAIGGCLMADFLFIFFKYPHHIKHWLPHIPPVLKRLLSYGLLIAIATITLFLIAEPYAIIDTNTYFQQTQEQSVMTHNPYIFPYTLQYVGKIPYIYELKNISLFGLGPLQAIISFLGILYALFLTYKKQSEKISEEAILLTFFLPYVIVVGRFSVGFMRYMLPVYPLFALFSALFVWRVYKILKQKLPPLVFYPLCTVFCISLLIWPVSFATIYGQPNTRVSATYWINQHIPQGSTLAVEHWDDQLPLLGAERYHTLTLTLYDPDTPMKWRTINALLSQTEYIIIASNRLYTPLQKLTDCRHLPPDRCYPTTAKYYTDLFSGHRGFHEVAEFTNYPHIPFTNIVINDQGADESFTVYDHPKVLIFQKN